MDNDIRNDWLTAMGSGSASVAASYDDAIHALASTSEVRFDIPGDFGPSWQPAFEARPVAEATPTMALPAEPAPTVPAAAPAIRPPTSPEPQKLSIDRPDDVTSTTPELATPLGGDKTYRDFADPDVQLPKTLPIGDEAAPLSPEEKFVALLKG